MQFVAGIWVWFVDPNNYCVFACSKLRFSTCLSNILYPTLHKLLQLGRVLKSLSYFSTEPPN
jgi:hypothetical protein